ncbi:MAG: hypothetical protein QOI95_2347 [Acidimicrobiaceae bacterium]|jgi:hypothetical protein
MLSVVAIALFQERTRGYGFALICGSLGAWLTGLRYEKYRKLSLQRPLTSEQRNEVLPVIRRRLLHPSKRALAERMKIEDDGSYATKAQRFAKRLTAVMLIAGLALIVV